MNRLRNNYYVFEIIFPAENYETKLAALECVRISELWKTKFNMIFESICVQYLYFLFGQLWCFCANVKTIWLFFCFWLFLVAYRIGHNLIFLPTFFRFHCTCKVATPLMSLLLLMRYISPVAWVKFMIRGPPTPFPLLHSLLYHPRIHSCTDVQ